MLTTDSSHTSLLARPRLDQSVQLILAATPIWVAATYGVVEISLGSCSDLMEGNRTFSRNSSVEKPRALSKRSLRAIDVHIPPMPPATLPTCNLQNLFAWGPTAPNNERHMRPEVRDSMTDVTSPPTSPFET